MRTDDILHANCVDALVGFPANSIDLTCTSPPYDDVRDYNGFCFDYKALGKELYRVTKDGGICAVVIGDGTQDFAKSMTSMRLAVDWCDNAGWRMFETCIYSRHGRPGAWWNQRFRVDHEYIFLFLKGDRPKHFDKSHMKVKAKYAGTEWHGTTRNTAGEMIVNKPHVLADTKCRGSIWHYATSNTEGNRIKMEHPATFPDELAVDIIKCFSQEGETVLDPFVGSGTTAVAAAQYGRRYVGIDISEEYVALAKQRLAREISTSIFED
jgi:DNA modification methylase